MTHRRSDTMSILENDGRRDYIICYKLNCPFCTHETETFDHIFQCPDGILFPQPIRCMTLEKHSREEDNAILNTTGRFLLLDAGPKGQRQVK